jgi:hypothetical protein
MLIYLDDDAVNLAVLWARAYAKMNQMQNEDECSVPEEFVNLITYLGSVRGLPEGPRQ